jgi:hypothetical protein
VSVFDIASFLIEAAQKKAREAQQPAAQIQAGLVPAPPRPQPAPVPPPPQAGRPQPAPVLARPPADSMPATAPVPVSPLLQALRGGNALIGGLIVGEVLAPPLSLRPRSLPGDTL